MRYNTLDCNNEKVEVMQRIKVINDTTYSCSTFVIKKDTVFIKSDTTNKFPEILQKVCK